MGQSAADRALEVYAQQKTLLAALGLISPRVRIDRQQLSAASTYTSPVWVPGQYEKLEIEFHGLLTSSYLQLQVNADTGANYSDYGNDNLNGTNTVDNAAKGANAFARLMQAITTGTVGVLTATFMPLTTGRERPGQYLGTTVAPAGTAATAIVRTGGFCWHNTAADVTSLTLFPTAGQTMTGVLSIFGYPAQ